MKVGDLVRIRHDTTHWLGHGVVLEIRAAGKQAKIRWFDAWDEDQIEWEQASALEVISEGR
jgi:hypothetical protein|tara:strand:- start:696 stop:878 length:183 start_codon:yes stop_codon:yes gene_type:complete